MGTLKSPINFSLEYEGPPLNQEHPKAILPNSHLDLRQYLQLTVLWTGKILKTVSKAYPSHTSWIREINTALCPESSLKASSPGKMGSGRGWGGYPRGVSLQVMDVSGSDTQGTRRNGTSHLFPFHIYFSQLFCQ